MWGLYLKISIVPAFFLFGVILYLLIKVKLVEITKIKKYKKIIISFIIFAIISNFQIMKLEDKYNNLYNNVQDAKIIGTIISDKKETDYKLSYTLKVESVNGNSKYKGTNLIIYTSKKEEFEYGNKVSLNGSFEKANQATNYRAFDYREYLKTKNIYGTINVEEIKKVKENNLNFILMCIQKTKTKIKSNLKEILGEEAKVSIGILLRRYIRNR